MAAPIPSEKTFSSYNAEQGKTYASVRPDYHPKVYQHVVDHHTATGGQLDTLIDIGCGPGVAARALAPRFNHVFGLDPSEGMIATARSSGGESGSAEPIRFEVSTAESLGQHLSPPVPDASVDLITAANAAHWFDMPGFYAAAARVLKPGGSIALWGTGEVRVHPSMPAADAIQTVLDDMLDSLEEYRTPGNRLVRGRYLDLPLPWTLEEPIAAFGRDAFYRKDYTMDEDFIQLPSEVGLDFFEKVLASGSAQVRWRQANPDKVGTEEDIMRVTRRKVEKLLHESGVEKGKETLKGALRGFLLIIKKTS